MRTKPSKGILWIISCILAMYMNPCEMRSNSDSRNPDGRSEFTGVGRQMPLNSRVTQSEAEIYNVKLADNVTFGGKV